MPDGLYAKRIELPRAWFKREPYILSTVVTESDFRAGKQEASVRTSPFKKVNKGNAAEVDVELLPPTEDPGEFIAAKIVVMESDEGFRRAGRIIGGAREIVARSSLGKRLFLGITASTGVSRAILDRAFTGLVDRLRSAGDDVLLNTTIVLTKEEGFRSGESWFEENKKCRLLLVCGDRPDGFDDSAEIDAVTDVWPEGPEEEGAPSHREMLESLTKEDIREWLDERGVSVPSDILKGDLVDIALREVREDFDPDPTA